MAYGFDDDKSKTEVYNKTESDNRYMRQGSTIGNRVDLKSFSGNTWAKDYTCPSDGYVHFHRDSGDFPMSVTIYISTVSTANDIIFASVGSGGTGIERTLFVKKGMVVRASGHASSESARNALGLWFYPIS